MSENISRVSLLRSTLFGAFFYAIWFVAELMAYSGFEVMGETDKTIQSFVESNYFWFNIFFQISILGVVLSIGAITGFFSGYFAKHSGRGHWFAYVCTALYWGAAQLRLLVHQPQFFDGPYLDNRPAFKEIVFWHTTWLDPWYARMLLIGMTAALAFYPMKNFLLWLAASGKRMAIAATVITVFSVAAAAASVSGTPQKNKPNILFIGIDSLRPDHLSGGGYKRDTTPVMDGIARDGAIFNRNIVDIARTFPSWVTMMTGVYTTTHGVRHMFPTVEQRRLAYPPLPKVLNRDGWQTAVVSDFAGDIFPRIDLGFQTVDAPNLTFDEIVKMRNLEIHPLALAFINNRLGFWMYPSIREMVYNCDPKILTDQALRVLDGFDNRKPFMLAMFYSTAHMPYAAPGPYYRRYTDPNYKGQHRFQKKNLLMKADTDTPEDVRHIVDIYDGGLRSIDDQIARLLDRLKARGYADNTIIVITGDHGENFYEDHAEIGHGNHLRGPHAITTPVIIYIPKRRFAVKTVDYQTRSIDIAPTLAELTGAKLMAPEGTSLLPYLYGKERGSRMAYSETGLWYINEGPFFFQKNRLDYPSITQLCEVDDDWDNEVVIKNRYHPLAVTAKHRMISDGRYKLIMMPKPDEPVFELYDIATDPEEKQNIVQQRPDIVSRLKDELANMVKNTSDSEIVNGYVFGKWEFTK